MPADGFLIIADPHAPAAVGAEGSQLVPFRARLYSHTVRSGNLDDLFAECQALLLRDFPGLREVLPDFGIQINEADDNGPCISVEGGSNLVKSPNLVIHCVPLGKKDRIETPAEGVDTDHVGQSFDIVQ